MGKKSKNTGKIHKQKNNNVKPTINTSGVSDISVSSDNKKKPFVSVCTPTFNRRPFIPAMIRNFLRQDYPHERMEWIIIDDGTDKIEDLVKDISCVKYFSYDKKMSLGKKRNLMHDKSSGDILVYMDDDDYYPPCRVSHAVEMLQTHPEALCSGSSEIYVYFNEIKKMYQFGPYGPNHATAGTFAFKKQLLKDHRYENEAALAEEKAFLKNYTVPFVQLDPIKTILVFSHDHNTFDKRKLLENPHPDYVRESPKTVDTFISEEDSKQFYTEEIIKVLKDYEPGRPEMKPDVIEQTKEIEKRRQEEAQKRAQQVEQSKITITTSDGTQKVLSNEEVVQIMRTLQDNNRELERIVGEKDNECKRLQSLNNLLLKRLRDATEVLNKQEQSDQAKIETETKPNPDTIIETDTETASETENVTMTIKETHPQTTTQEQDKSSIIDNSTKKHVFVEPTDADVIIDELFK